MLLHSRYETDARVKREARSLARRYDVRVLYLCDRGQSPGHSRDGDVAVEAIQIWSRGLPRSPIFWALKYLEFIARSAWRALRVRPSALHAHDLPMMIPAWLASLFLRVPVVYDAHELYPDMSQHSAGLARAWRRIDRFAVRRAARVIAVNESRAQVMVDELGAPPPAIVANLPVAITDGERPPRDASPLRRFVAERVPGEPRILLYQGVMMPGRSLDVAVRAIAAARTECVLVLLGYASPTVDALLALAGELGVAERVLYHEGVDSDALPAYTAGADAGLVIYASTPRNNYLCAPNKLFEYCMAGVPVLGCDFPEVARVLADSPAGELFDVASPDSCARALDRLLGSEESLARAREATAAIRAEHHWGAAERVLQELYSGLLPEESPPT